MSAKIPVIRKLDDATVNRIAAGEVVQNPASAIKEMLENSLDAGSTNITIVAKEGGMQFLQITDNGHGIRKDDLEIVCERFTTSKIACYEDLQSVSTFGFRGEALASITHVAHVQIITRTADQQCAYKAKYSDGQLIPIKIGEKPHPIPCAGRIGTSITVEDLFYNMPTRKQAFKNYSEQYQRLLDVVTKYAIHYGDKQISITCKKLGHATADIHTSTSASTLVNIKNVYGNCLAKELLQFEISFGIINNQESHSLVNTKCSIEDELAFSCNGYISNANYSNKKATCILFINNRLVECTAIKRVVESVYSDILPKHTHPFIYLSFWMRPQNVDVNVHPTKKEVHFMFEERILEVIYENVHKHLQGANSSRVFYTQTLLPNSTNEIFKPEKNRSEITSTHDADSNTIQSKGNSTSNRIQSMDTDTDNDVIRFSLSAVDEEMRAAGIISDSRLLPKKRDRQYDIPILGEQEDSDIRDAVEDERTPSAAVSAPLATQIQQAQIHTQKKTTHTVAPNKMVRVDSSIPKIDSFFSKSRPSPSPSLSLSLAASLEAGRESEYESELVSSAVSLVEETCECPPGAITVLEDRGAISAVGVDDEGQTQTQVHESAVQALKRSKPRSTRPGAFALPKCACCQRRVGSNPNPSVLPAASEEVAAQYGPAGSSIKDTQSRPSKKLPLLEDSTCEYESVRNLVESMWSRRHGGLETVLKRNTVVGVVDEEFLLIQHETKLLLLDYTILSRETLYQIVLRRFGALPSIKIRPLPIEQLLCTAIENPEAQWTPEDGDKNNLVSAMRSLLLQKAPMLLEYFSIGFDVECSTLIGLPELVTGLLPVDEALPMFLLHLATCIDWSNEEACFDGVAQELAQCFAQLPRFVPSVPDPPADQTQPTPLPSVPFLLTDTNKSSKGSSKQLSTDAIERVTDVLWPMVKAYLIPPREFLDDNIVLLVASLEQLYKIFERC